MALIFSKNRSGEYGYDRQAVDIFFANCQTAYESQPASIDVLKLANSSFPLVKVGYYTAEVDQAINKLIYSVLEYKRDLAHNSGQQDLWEKEYSRTIYDLESTLNADKGKMFSRGEKKVFSYKRRQVEKFMDKLKKYFFESGKKITLEDLDKVCFSVTKRASGYSEKEVDQFLNKVRILLLTPTRKTNSV
ncbi:MAG: DivIVA domain-containing protein [Bifidobacteriaceae bacterium]|jgi:DivIVA domain-containing protein|nr:DivIVA domain-containing protein [Bifidobacteriaceae bacterium]